MEHPHPRHKINHDTYYRLADMQWGRLNAQKDAITSPTFAQRWLLDATGNWGNFKQDDDGDGTWNLDQDRTANTVNEITDITETAGPSWATPAYNLAGNMTTVPQPVDPTTSYAAAFDAWNRLVKLSDGANTVQENEYDGLRRRTVRRHYVSGSLDETRHFYYSDSWQVLEERLDSSTDPDRQFVWGLRYIDDCVLRDRDTDANGTLDERLYACQDANWNVTTLADAAGDVQERYAYSAYGVPEFLTPAFGSRAASSFSWETLYAGYRYDIATGLFNIRNRGFHSLFGTWLQRDPFGLAVGINLYEYCNSFPEVLTDPMGTAAVPPKPKPIDPCDDEFNACKNLCDKQPAACGLVGVALFADCLLHRSIICRAVCFFFPPLCAQCIAANVAFCLVEQLIFLAACLAWWDACKKDCEDRRKKCKERERKLACVDGVLTWIPA